ncbi:hypothetical protein [Mucilaginibacter pedocola]|uniref:Uncharacterized protein n=1 Tax=Mucilaginibacter pedocola TaxID=1792845 RepID=A0A1S9PGQ6_9SPHI|nr:hypothetical protein [Mucilaginibacter pedocola]OOQ60131.1 hypothetical protein BC343_26795 [Mucilaginibacter pedocola]
MFSLFKRKNKLEVPDWALFLNADEYERFLKAVEKYFYQKNVTYTLGDGVINAGPNDFGFNVLGLMNVAQQCKFNDGRSYTEIVDEHFETMLRANKFDKEFQKVIDDYEQIEQYLAVRLYHTSYFDSVGYENVIGEALAGNIFAALVFDLPDGIVSIKPEQAEKWGKNYKELMDVGKSNVERNCSIELLKEDFDGLTIWLAQGEHFFTGNIVFNLEIYPQFAGKHGMLVGVPHRHCVIMYPINNLEVISAINKLIPLIYNMNEEGPGSISSNLFWYANGKFEYQPYKIEEDKIQFTPTENFLNMLNMLEEK